MSARLPQEANMKRGTLLLIGALALTAACAEVLGIRPPDRRPFEHRAHVLKGINCNRCHDKIAAAGEEGPLHLPSTGDCRSCHEKPHNEAPCGQCHGLASTRAAAVNARQTLRFTHSAHVSRLKGDCVRCHLDIGRGAETLLPRMAICGSCHEHQEQLASGPKQSCDPCHVDLHAEAVKPDDHLIHGANFLREHGVRAASNRSVCVSCHTERGCAACHGASVPALPERLHFDDPMRAGVHRAGFRSRHSEEARSDPGLCATCHTTTACSDCHTRENVGAATGKSPHPKGWLGLPGQPNDHGRAAWREPELCASCHGGAGEALCVGCHKVGGIGGNPHHPSFTSRKDPKTARPCFACHGGAL